MLKAMVHPALYLSLTGDGEAVLHKWSQGISNQASSRGGEHSSTRVTFGGALLEARGGSLSTPSSSMAAAGRTMVRLQCSHNFRLGKKLCMYHKSSIDSILRFCLPLFPMVYPTPTAMDFS